MVASVNLVQLRANLGASWELKDGSLSTSFTPTIRRAALTVCTPITHNAHSVTLERSGVAFLLLGLNRRTISTSSRNSVTSAVLLILNLLRIRRQARHRARTPFSVRGVGARNWAGTVVTRALFIVPLTATITKRQNVSGMVLEAQTAIAAAIGPL
jgi:hypothetical protein